MIEHECSVIAQFARNRAEVVGASRFLHNDAVSLEALLGATRAHCAARVEGRHVLSIQDTTALNYARHSGLLKVSDPELGPVNTKGDVGLFLHPSLVLDAQTGFAVGFSDLYVWNRRWNQHDKHLRGYNRQPIEAKESFRWIASSRHSQQTLARARRVTILADREADIYEEFVLVPDERTHVLIRSRSDRRLAGTDQTLYTCLEGLPKAGQYTLQVEATHRRAARTASIEVRFTRVALAKPDSNRHAASLPASIELSAVEARESAESVPAGEAPVLWRLLTTHPVETLEQALTVIGYYSKRPQIEQVFRLLKQQGLRLEESQLESGAALKKMAVLSLHVALVLMQLVSAREGSFAESAEVVFTQQAMPFLRALQSELEGKTKKQQCPHEVGTLAWACWIVARLGGWTGYARASPAGPITMRRGLERLESRYAGWQLAHRR